MVDITAAVNKIIKHNAPQIRLWLVHAVNAGEEQTLKQSNNIY